MADGDTVGRLEARFTIDLSPLRRGLRTASGMLEKWARDHDEDPQASVGLNLSPLRSGLSQASAMLQRFDGSEAEANITLGGLANFRRGLSQASSSLSRFDGSDATATVKADVTPARRALAEFRGTLANLSRQSAAVRVQANTTDARESVEHFLTWLRQQRAELNITAVTDEAQRAAEIAKAYIETLSAKIDVGASTAAAIAEGRLAAGRINQMSPQFDVGAQTSGAMGDVQGVVRRTNAMRGNFSVGANTQPAESELAGFNQTIRRYSRSWGTQGIRARVQADASQAQAQVRNLERILDRTTDPTHRVRVEAETARARGQLRGIQQIATGLGMQDPTMSVGVRGVAASTAQMLGLWKLADRLDGYNVTFSANVDQTISKILPQALGALEQQVARFRSIATATAAVSVPALQTAIASLPGVISMAATAAGALATRLGAGVAGAMGSVGSAAVLGGAALGAYGYTMRRTLSYAFNLSSVLGDQVNRIEDAKDAQKQAAAAVASATPGTEKYRRAQMGLAFANQNAAFEQRRMNAMLGYATPKMLKLNSAANDMSIEFIKLGAATSNATAPMLTRWIQGLTGVMQRSRGEIVGMITDMNRVAASFVRTMSKSREFANLSTIFSGIRSAGVPAMRILTNVIRLFVNTFAATVPAGLKVLNVLSRVTTAAARWSGTAAGQSRIRAVWQSLAAAGAQLWRIVRDLGIGLGGVIIALNQTGIGQSMMNGLEGVAGGFRNVMRAGGAGRQAIVEMGHATRPALSAMADLVRYLGVQFGLMAMEVAKSGVVTDTIKAIHTALKGTETSMGIIPMLRHEFEVIGPLLPPLIKALGLWFSTFAYAQPEMVLFIKTITRMLEMFNSLPQPVQRTAARILAWGSVIQMLGGTALVGLIAKIFLFRRAMATMRAVQAANGAAMATQAGIFSRMGTAIRGAAAATWTYTRAATVAAARSTAAGVAAAASAIKVRVLSVATRAAAVGMRAMGVAATFMLGPWGLVIAGVIALGAALIIAYRRSETFRNAVNALGNFIRSTAVAAFRGLVNAARSVWQWFTRLPAPIQMLISPIGALVANFGRVKAALGSAAAAVGRFIGRLAVGAVRVFGNVLRFLWNAAKPVVTWLGQAAMAVGRFIARLAAQRVRQYGAVLRFLWQMAKPVIQWLGRAAVAVGKFVARLAVGAVRVFGRVLGAIWKAAQPVVNWIGRAAATVGRFIAKLAVGAVRVFGRVIGAIWRAAKPVVTWLGKAAVAAGRFLLKLDGLAGVRAFVAVVKAIWRAAKPVVQWLGKAAVAVGKFLARLAVKGLRLFVNGLRAIWNGARTLIRWIGDAANAVGRFVNRGRESAASLRGVWNRFWSGLKALWNRSLTAIGNRLESWRDAFRSLVERIAGWVRGRWDAFWGGLRGLWNRALTAIGNRTESWRDAFRSLVDRIAKWIRGRWDAFWGGLKGLWDRSLTAVGNRTESWRDALRNLFDNIAKWARGRWDSFWSGMRGLWDRAFSAIGDRARSWGQAIKDIFLKVKGWMTSPMEKARDILKGIWNSILGGIGKVLGAVGLKEAAGKINGAKWATGGTTADNGGQAFANGGTTTGFRAFANGGMGTSSKQPRVHMWNEQMGHEGYATERGNSRTQLGYINTMAGWHGAQVVPYEKGGFASRGYDPPQRRPHRRDPGTTSLVDPYKHRGKIGGEGFGPTTYNWSPLMQGYVNQVRSKFPVSVNTYTNHPGGERNSADAWAPGGRGSAINRGTGDSVASWLVDNVGELNWLIWAGRILTGGGWKPYNGFGGPHHDHVHWTAGKPGGASAKGGGFSVPNPMQILFDKTWNNTVGRIMDRFRGDMEGGHVLRQGTAGAATIVTQGIHKWIDDKIPDTIGGGGGGGSTKQMREWARSGLSYGGVYPPSDANVSKVVTLMGKESSGDPNAKNPSGASGLMQMKPATFNQYKKAPGDQIMNPMHNVGASTRYQQGRYGKLVTHSPYLRGGVVPGMGPKYLMAHGGERVLPRDLNVGFESLSRSIDSWNSRGASAPSVDVGGERDREIVSELRHLRSENARQGAQLHALVSALPDGIKESVDENLANGERTPRMVEKGQKRRQKVHDAQGRRR